MSELTDLPNIDPRLADALIKEGITSPDELAEVGSTRGLVALRVLTALGGCESQLKVHIEAALNVGSPVRRSPGPSSTPPSIADSPELTAILWLVGSSPLRLKPVITNRLVAAYEFH